MASRELTPIPTGATTGTGTAAINGSNTSTPLMPSIVQISRPFSLIKKYHIYIIKPFQKVLNLIILILK